MPGNIGQFFSSDQFMPHGHCYLWQTPLVLTMVISDGLIGVAYVSISLSLYLLVKKIRLPFTPMFVAFGLFILACGMTHFMEIYNLWVPNYWLAALVKIVTAAASVATALLMFPVGPKIAAVSEAAALSERRKRELETLNESLDIKVKDRTKDLQRAVEARNEFLSIASHELRTPISPAIMQLQMMELELKKASQGPTAPVNLNSLINGVGISLRNLRSMSSLLDTLLDVSRIQAGKMDLNLTRVDLVQLLREAVQRFQIAAEKHKSVVINFSADDSQLLCICDSVRINQVITNLISNAIKYGAGNPVDVLIKSDRDSAEIRVTDRGVGIAPDKFGLIFDRFERAADLNVPGLGMGLYISRQILTAHHGEIRVESELGKGSTFIVTMTKALS